MKLESMSLTQVSPVSVDFGLIKPNSELPSGPKDSINQGYSEAFRKPVSEKLINETVKKVNKLINATDSNIELSVHKSTREIVVKIKDNQTGKVIRQFPSEKTLAIADYMRKMSGILVDTKV
jgi:uncharacterized FlaG/YvyC family protein